MEILLNNRKEILEFDQLSVQELLRIKNFTFKMLIVKINDNYIKKNEYNSAIIKTGDEVLVLHMISGG